MLKADQRMESGDLAGLSKPLCKCVSWRVTPETVTPQPWRLQARFAHRVVHQGGSGRGSTGGTAGALVSSTVWAESPSGVAVIVIK
jgi:hypothetical protein